MIKNDYSGAQPVCGHRKQGTQREGKPVWLPETEPNIPTGHQIDLTVMWKLQKNESAVGPKLETDKANKGMNQ